MKRLVQISAAIALAVTASWIWSLYTAYRLQVPVESRAELLLAATLVWATVLGMIGSATSLVQQHETALAAKRASTRPVLTLATTLFGDEQGVGIAIHNGGVGPAQKVRFTVIEEPRDEFRVSNLDIFKSGIPVLPTNQFRIISTGQTRHKFPRDWRYTIRVDYESIDDDAFHGTFTLGEDELDHVRRPGLDPSHRDHVLHRIDRGIRQLPRALRAKGGDEADPAVSALYPPRS